MPSSRALLVSCLLATLPVVALAQPAASPLANAVPVAAFFDGSTVHLVDLEVRGTFPSAFTLAALPASPAGIVEGTGAWRGIIAAAPRGHPATYAVPRRSAKVTCPPGVAAPVLDNQPEAGPFLARPLGPGAECTYELTVTRDAETYYEKHVCGPSFVGFLASCPRVEQRGDADLLRDPWSVLLGHGGALSILYAHRALPAGSYWSTGAAGGRALSHGMYLLQRVPLTAGEVAANERCREALVRRAISVYNRKHGTAFDFDTDGAFGSDTMFEELVAILEDFLNNETCLKLDQHLVEDIGARTISVRAGRVDASLF